MKKLGRKSLVSVFSLLSLLLLMWMPHTALALTFPIPAKGDVIGEVKKVKARGGETLADVGRRYGVGRDEMVGANPGFDNRQRLSSGTRLVVPSQYILPPGSRKGIVINLAELRLYYYPPGQNIVITEAVGIGREGIGGWQTPTGSTEIIGKQKDPPWRPPDSVRAEAARNGTPIPRYFPPGKNNPLGEYAMRLGWTSYLIHGTNRPDGVGSRVSAGCIRMYPEGIEALFPLISVGTSVRIINEPFKTGWLNGKLYFEAHRPLVEEENKYAADMAAVVKTVYNNTQYQDTFVKWSIVEKAANGFSGIPAIIGYR